MKSALFSCALSGFSGAPRFRTDEGEVPEQDIYTSVVDVFANNLLPWPEGKISTSRSLEIPELNKRDGSIGISDQ